MKRKKVGKIISAFAATMIASSANAWMYDGENYIGINAQYGAGSIESEVIVSQAVGLELGRNFSPDWYGAVVLEYSTYDIKQSSTIDEKGLNGLDVCGKIGYRPTKSTLVYGLAGIAIQKESNGVLFSGGLRWNIFQNAGFFIEGRSMSVTSNGKNYTSVYGLGGINLFLNF
jgi:hypothetical protein